MHISKLNIHSPPNFSILWYKKKYNIFLLSSFYWTKKNHFLDDWYQHRDSFIIIIVIIKMNDHNKKWYITLSNKVVNLKHDYLLIDYNEQNKWVFCETLNITFRPQGCDNEFQVPNAARMFVYATIYFNVRVCHIRFGFSAGCWFGRRYKLIVCRSTINTSSRKPLRWTPTSL